MTVFHPQIRTQDLTKARVLVWEDNYIQAKGLEHLQWTLTWKVQAMCGHLTLVSNVYSPRNVLIP